jgi:hypothetical protein
MTKAGALIIEKSRMKLIKYFCQYTFIFNLTVKLDEVVILWQLNLLYHTDNHIKKGVII